MYVFFESNFKYPNWYIDKSCAEKNKVLKNTESKGRYDYCGAHMYYRY